MLGQGFTSPSRIAIHIAVALILFAAAVLLAGCG
jgi:hypothetical protein